MNREMKDEILLLCNNFITDYGRKNKMSPVIFSKYEVMESIVPIVLIEDYYRRIIIKQRKQKIDKLCKKMKV